MTTETAPLRLCQAGCGKPIVRRPTESNPSFGRRLYCCQRCALLHRNGRPHDAAPNTSRAAKATVEPPDVRAPHFATDFQRRAFHRAAILAALAEGPLDVATLLVRGVAVGCDPIDLEDDLAEMEDEGRVRTWKSGSVRMAAGMGGAA